MSSWFFKKRTKYGFTAIEITMVATIIAIIALIVLPVFRKRTAEARVNAAQDGLVGIGKAEAIAFADSGKFFRLMDLDNTEVFTSTIDDPDIEVPRTTWNQVLTTQGRSALREQWQGPYANTQSFITLEDIMKAPEDGGRPYMLSLNGGPIFILRAGDPRFQTTMVEDSLEDKIPTDPWDSPYIFFGTGQLVPGDATETDYKSTVVYSLGPDGVPGEDLTLQAEIENPANYRRGSPYLGTGDDLTHYF